MATKLYCDLLQQGFMKTCKVVRGQNKSAEEKAAELSKLLSVSVVPAGNGRFKVPHANGYDNFLTYVEAKKMVSRAI